MIADLLSVLAKIILDVIDAMGYAGVFALMFLQSMNIPIPSEVTMPFSGFLASQGDFIFFFVVLSGTAGNILGAVASYFLAGLFVRNGLREKYAVLKFLISDDHLSLAQRWFEKYGPASVFFGRMVPVLSTFISFPAGLAKMKLSKFIAFTSLGAFFWCLGLAGAGYILGENWHILGGYFRKFDYLILVVMLVAGIWWVFRRLKRKKP